MDLTSGLFDKVVGNGQAETGSFTHLLGGKKRIKYGFKVLFAYTDTIILKADTDQVTIFLRLNAGCCQADRTIFNDTFLFNGINGVQDAVEENLTQAVTVGSDMAVFSQKISRVNNINSCFSDTDSIYNILEQRMDFYCGNRCGRRCSGKIKEISDKGVDPAPAIYK